MSLPKVLLLCGLALAAPLLAAPAPLTSTAALRSGPRTMGRHVTDEASAEARRDDGDTATTRVTIGPGFGCEALEQRVIRFAPGRSRPRTSGIELISMIQQRYPGIPCLMISGRAAGQYVKRSLAAGARGYVLKDDIQDVMKGIQHVLEGGTYLSERLNGEE